MNKKTTTKPTKTVTTPLYSVCLEIDEKKFSFEGDTPIKAAENFTTIMRDRELGFLIKTKGTVTLTKGKQKASQDLTVYQTKRFFNTQLFKDLLLKKLELRLKHE